MLILINVTSIVFNSPRFPKCLFCRKSDRHKKRRKSSDKKRRKKERKHKKESKRMKKDKMKNDTEVEVKMPSPSKEGIHM